MSTLTFYIAVVQALEEIKAPYMIVGAFAGLAFGVIRATFDIDILVDLRPEETEKLASRFPLPRYYADPIMMRNSIRQGIMFKGMLEEGLRRREREAGVGLGRFAPPSPPPPAFLTCTARRRKCVQQRNCRGDGASLVFCALVQLG